MRAAYKIVVSRIRKRDLIYVNTLQTHLCVRIECYYFILTFPNIVLNALTHKWSQLKKSFNYKLLDIVKHYNFSIGHVFIWDCFKKFKILNIKIWELKTNIWESK
jgi:hypothetical protein